MVHRQSRRGSIFYELRVPDRLPAATAIIRHDSPFVVVQTSPTSHACYLAGSARVSTHTHVLLATDVHLTICGPIPMRLPFSFSQKVYHNYRTNATFDVYHMRCRTKLNQLLHKTTKRWAGIETLRIPFVILLLSRILLVNN